MPQLPPQCFSSYLILHCRHLGDGWIVSDVQCVRSSFISVPRAGRRIEMIWDLTLPENMVIFRMNVTLFFLKLQYQTEKNMIPFSGSSSFIILDGACLTMSSTGSFSQILRNQKRLYPICSHIFDMKLFKKLFYDFLHFFKHCSLLRQLSTSDWHSVKHCWECATVHEKINKNSTKRRATRSRLSREPRSLSSHRPREYNRSPNEEEDVWERVAPRDDVWRQRYSLCANSVSCTTPNLIKKKARNDDDDDDGNNSQVQRWPCKPSQVLPDGSTEQSCWHL